MSTKKEKAGTAIDGLEEASNDLNNTTDKKVKKEQTAEERTMLEAGIAQLQEIGVSENLKKVLSLVPEWNGDKENLSAVKETVIAGFGGSDKLKDYIDGPFQDEVLAFQGIAKTMPVLNNIKSFYARRENAGTTRKVKTVQVSIAGITYNVDAAYRDEIAALPAEERKELLLAHAGTKKAEVIEEII